MEPVDKIKRQVLEILHNLNWLMEPHNGYAELVGIKGKKVVIRSVGPCNECEKDCIGVAFKERMPQMSLVRQ